MWVRGNEWIRFLLCGWMAAAFCFLACYPGWGGVGAKGSGCFVCEWGAPFSLTCTHLRIETLQGSLPDFKCEIDVNIGFS